MKLTSPCYINGQDCSKRHEYCAADCAEWKDYVEKRNKLYEEIRRNKTDTMTIGKYRNIRRNRKRR